jgi:TorA maturation chaperone TorD
MPDTPTPDAATRCLERALLHRLLSVAFRHPDEGTPEELRRLAAAASGASRLPPRTRERLESAARALAGVDANALVARHERAFGHSVRSGATPYETEYGDSNDTFIQSRDLADIGGFYLAAGLRLDAPERPDHVATEFEFMQFLARKEAHGHEAGDAELVELMDAMQRMFVADHVGRFGPELCRRLVAGGGVYARLGALAAAVIEDERARLRVEPPRARLDLTDPQFGPEEPFGCSPWPAHDADATGFQV